MLIPEDWSVRSFSKSVKSKFKRNRRDPASSNNTIAKSQVNATSGNAGGQSCLKAADPCPSGAERQATIALSASAAEMQTDVPIADDLKEQGGVLPLGDKLRDEGAQSRSGARSPEPQHQGQVAQFFAGAHHLLFNNPTMIDQLTQVFETGRTVLQLLENRRVSGAEVDSSARYPPPLCHPETRKELRGKITAWLNDPQRRWRMLWLLGPAGTGKSAVAQTIAEHCQAIDRLGAAFFFSKLNNRNDPLRVIPTLSYQLAVQYPEYKHLITQRLADNPSILEKNIRSQFKKFIVEPFTILKERYRFSVKQPLLVILDGLDECNGRQAQCEFIELISEHVRLVDSFPLLWMICSRPEWHLKSLLMRADFEIACRREELSIDDTEAQQDVLRFLRDGFIDIRQRHWDVIEVEEGESWPSETQLRQLASAASGLFIFASTILKFISDDNFDDPNRRLELCLRVAGGLGSPGTINPLHTLDLLYRQILAEVPAGVLPTAMRILGLHILFPDNQFTAQETSNFFCLERSLSYTSLRCLHSVLDIPPPAEAGEKPLRFYHASFGEFLRDPSRSGQFALDEKAACKDIAMLSLQWYNRAIESYCVLEDKSLCRSVFPEVKWSTGQTDSHNCLFRHLHSFVDESTWCLGGDEDISQVMNEIREIYFCHMGPVSFARFPQFVDWLYNLGERNEGLIRIIPNCETDNALLQKCGKPLKPAKFPIAREFDILVWLSLHNDHWKTRREVEGMFFLGRGSRACLLGYET